MKFDKKTLKEHINSLIWKRLNEAEEEAPKDDAGEDNPFAGGGDEGGDEGGEDKEADTEEPAADTEGDEKADDKKDTAKGAAPSGGLTIKFNASSVKKYNKANFLSDEGTVKSISKDGIIVTTQPDGVDVLVNFDDISESVRKFFKKKK